MAVFVETPESKVYGMFQPPEIYKTEIKGEENRPENQPYDNKWNLTAQFQSNSCEWIPKEEFVHDVE